MHLRNMPVGTFYNRLFEAQEWLRLKQEDCLLTKPYIDNLLAQAKEVPDAPKPGELEAKNNKS